MLIAKDYVIIICESGDMAYIRSDGVKVISIDCLKD